ncbi:MAG: DNA mismatch repair endonuclease MutL [Spirochaetota bacterium]|nr:MAG: DNA mismatch repair endonuclease MutL [Spirochaetota bacterium]
MGKIITLPQEVSDKIAAGEVIEGPHSVVRELLDNALDAGATQISVTVNNGGKDFIQVADNGYGMVEEDAVLSIEKHSTSKITDIEDLNAISSIGFRGEALSSICAVSDFSMLTGTPETIHGTRVNCRYGKDTSSEPHASNRGTQVTVRNLFQNLPARMKFLKSNRSETAKIKEELLKKALSFYERGIFFKADDRVIYSLKPRNEVLDRIGDIFGDNIKNKLVATKVKKEHFSFTLYISDQSCTLSNRSGQFFFVNRRPVTDRSLYIALNNSAKATIPAGRYVYAFVYIDIDPTLIDVNVHPAKKEIKIKLMGKLFSSLSGAVTQSLAPVAFEEQRFTIDIAESRAEYTQADMLVREPHGFETEDRVYEASYASVYQQDVFPVVIEKLIFKGVIFSTYVFFESDDFILLIDQHAAHERVLYEKLKKEAGESTYRKSLLIPITFTPPRSHLEDLTESLETFQEAGIVIEPFGEESFNITEIPSFVPEEKEEETLSILFEEFYEGSLKVTTRDIRDRFLKIAACRHAVKEGDKLTQDEAFRLLEDLGKTEVPYMCPHGRPTVIKQRKQYFEKLFRRR